MAHDRLKISLRNSNSLLTILVFVHAGAVGLTWTLGLPFWIKLTLNLILLLSGGFCVWKNFAFAIRAFELREGGVCYFRDRKDRWIEAKVLETSFVSAHLAVLNIRTLDRWLVKHIVIVPDAIDAEDFRKLRVWLKWKLGKELSAV